MDQNFQTLDLQACLDRMKEGDAAARNELIGGVCQRLEHLARKMLRNYPRIKRWTDTDDVFQNSVIRLMRSLEHVQPETMSAFFGLAATQIRRELIDLARHYYGPQGLGTHQKQISTHLSEEGNESFDPPDLTQNSNDLERWAQFHEEVENLPPKQREVFSLIYYHGWTQKQVGELFGVVERTVRTWWHETLDSLREKLQGEIPT